MGERRPQVAFIGSYAPPDEHGIHIVTFDDVGTPVWQGGVGGIRNPSYLCVAPDRRHLYAVSETGLATDGVAGGVVALRIEERDGAVDLVQVSRRSTDGDHPCHVGIDPSGRWLVVVNYGSGDLVVIPVGDDGSLGEPTARVRHTGRGPDEGRQSAPHPHGSAFSPDGRFVLVADLGIDRVIVYAFGARDGTLDPHEVFEAMPGSGPRHLALHPDGAFVFAVNELNCTVTALGWDANAGTLVELQTVSTLPPGSAGPSLAAAVKVSPSGRHVHVSTRGADLVTTYAFDPGGGLELVAVRSAAGRWPRDLAVASGGEFLLVANERSDEVVVLSAGTDAGPLGPSGASVGVPRPTAIACGYLRGS